MDQLTVDISKVLKMLVKSSNYLPCRYYILILVGIPIDMVCGTSMGAFMGALYCQTCDADKVYELAQDYFKPKEFFKLITSVWKFITGLTFPVIAMTDGECYNYI